MKQQFAIAILLTLAVAPLGQLSWAQRAEQKIKLTTREVSLGKLLPGHVLESVSVSPDYKRVAYLTTTRNKKGLALGIAIGLLLPQLLTSGYLGSFRDSRMVENGVQGKEYSDISSAMFSPDSKHILYVAERAAIVLDDVKGKNYLISSIPIFSPDSKRLVFKTLDVKRWSLKLRTVVVTDNVKGVKYAATDFPVFSSDSKHVAYTAKRDDKWFVVVDGVEVKESAWGPVYSSNSQRLAYMAQRGSKKVVLIVDGVEGAEFDQIGPEPRVKTYYNRAAQLEYDEIEPREREIFSKKSPIDEATRAVWFSILSNPERGYTQHVVFSPDNKRIAYTAKRGDKWMVVLDGEEGQGYQDVVGLVFSPDSKRIAYTASRNGKWRLVVDKSEGEEFDIALSPVFSPDSQRVAYTALRNRKWIVVTDNVESDEYEQALWPVFSPDSRHVAFAAMRNGKWVVVVDGVVADKLYDEIDFNTAAFSPDGRHFAYVARRGNRYVVVVDGVEGAEYDALLRYKLVFDSPNLLKTIGLRNQELFTVEVEVAKN